ncbi:MAG: hypothetical protein AAF988_06535 [Pseudomonadota bacterium]
MIILGKQPNRLKALKHIFFKAAEMVLNSVIKISDDRLRHSLADEYKVPKSTSLELLSRISSGRVREGLFKPMAVPKL